jgi:hypothetical protein
MKLVSLLFLLLPLLALAASSTSTAAYQQGDALEEADVRSIHLLKSTALVSAITCTLYDYILQ